MLFSVHAYMLNSNVVAFYIAATDSILCVCVCVKLIFLNTDKQIKERCNLIATPIPHLHYSLCTKNQCLPCIHMQILWSSRLTASDAIRVPTKKLRNLLVSDVRILFPTKSRTAYKKLDT